MLWVISEYDSAGTGNGTFHELSVKGDVFEKIISAFQLPAHALHVLASIHPCICRFMEGSDGEGFLSEYRQYVMRHGQSLTSITAIIYSMPKGPVREIFCAMRVSLSDSSTVCLIFDCKEDDLRGDEGLLEVLKYTWTHDHAMRNPIGILILLTVQCGQTSELNRKMRDNEVLKIEIRTKSTLWNDPNETMKKSPSDYLKTTIFAHICNNNLLFLSNAVAFEIETWMFIQSLMKDGVLGWKKRMLKQPAKRMRIADEIKYHLQYAGNRKAQIKLLQSRTNAQINQINLV